MRTLTTSLVREYFEYRDGEIYWKKRPAKKGSVGVGDRFGSLDSEGYRRGEFRRKRVREHQIVWLLFNDTFPPSIDHIDGNRLNNRIENLRASTQAQNIRNSKLRKDNKTGIKGVTINPSGTYAVRIGVAGKCLFFGSYKDLELAALVADEARALYHGAFARYK